MIKSLSLLLVLSLCACASAPQHFAEVNAKVNSSIKYKSDKELFGVSDKWQRPNETEKLGKGDCEDYVLLKAEKLQEPGSKMLFAKSKKTGEIHAVLLADNFVLDNITDEIKSLPVFLRRYEYINEVEMSKIDSIFKHKFN